MEKSWLEKNAQPFIAVVTILAGFGYLFLFPDRNTAVVVGLMTFALGYYFGTSVGSARKDDLLRIIKGDSGSTPLPY